MPSSMRRPSRRCRGRADAVGAAPARRRAISPSPSIRATHTERYQGIVELIGATLAECVHHYFRQSEQVRGRLSRSRPRVRRWRRPAGAPARLMLQRLPAERHRRWRDEADDGWRRALVLHGELHARPSWSTRDLAPDDLLYRLFHEDGVRVFRGHALRAELPLLARARRVACCEPCRAEELDELKVDGAVVVTCEFCSARCEFCAAGRGPQGRRRSVGRPRVLRGAFAAQRSAAQKACRPRAGRAR